MSKNVGSTVNVMPPLGEGWSNIGDLHGDLCNCSYTRALILVQISGVTSHPLHGAATFVTNIIPVETINFVYVYKHIAACYTNAPTLGQCRLIKPPDNAPSSPTLCPRGGDGA